MLPPMDRDFDHNVSVANFPSRVLTLKYLSARYLRESGKMAERTPRWVVARSVARARAGPIPKCSANLSAVIFLCRSCEMKDWRGWTLSTVASAIEYCTLIYLLRLSLRLLEVGSVEIVSDVIAWMSMAGDAFI